MDLIIVWTVGCVSFLWEYLGTFGILCEGCRCEFTAAGTANQVEWVYLDGRSSRILWHDALFL